METKTNKEGEDVILSVPVEKYRFLLKTVESFKNGIRMLKMNELYKQSLMREINIVESILKIKKKGNYHGYKQVREIPGNDNTGIPSGSSIPHGGIG